MTEDVSAIYERQRIGGALGFGNRCALLIVDFVNGFADPDVLGGGNIVQAIESTMTFLAASRRARLPVVFTRIVYEKAQTNSVFCRKMPSLADLVETNPQSAIVPQLTVEHGDFVIRKTQPSAFFGTNLAGYFVACGVDTLLIAGCTTSGCVRASVVDAMSHNFRPVVVEQCVGDRALEPHRANLFDMSRKYADVVGLDKVLSHLNRVNNAEESVHAD